MSDHNEPTQGGALPSVPLQPVVLHPCPFCGAAGNLLDLDLFRDQHGGVFYIVRCGGCLCDGPIGLSKEGAATVWNVRFAIMQNPTADRRATENEKTNE